MGNTTNNNLGRSSDSVSHKILEILQRDARTSQADIGRKVGLTASSVNARIKRLEKNGFITGYVARLDPVKVGCEITAFVEVDVEHPRHEKVFTALMEKLDEVQECHHITGQYSFLIKIRTINIATLKKIILGKIAVLPGIRGTRSLVVLDTAKESSFLSLDGLKQVR